MRPSHFDLRTLIPSCALFLFALASCSLGTVDRAACDPQSCQQAFGFGSICRDDGLCERAQFPVPCQKTYPADLLTDTAAYRDAIVFGVLMDRQQPNQLRREYSIELAARGANSYGGLQERQFGIVFCDIHGDSDAARLENSVAQGLFLADDLGLPAIVGPSSSGDVQAVFLALEERNLNTLVISPSATSPLLTGIDEPAPTDENPGLLWRTAPSDAVQSRQIAADMTLRGITSVVLIHASNAYGDGIAQEFDANFGGTVMLAPFSNPTQLSEQIAIVASSTAQEVLFASSQTTEGVSFVLGALGLTGYDTKNLFLTDSAGTSTFADQIRTQAGARLSSIRVTRPAPVMGFVYDTFRTSFSTQFSEDVSAFSFTAQSYDAAWLVMYGIAWAQLRESGITGPNIARGLRHVTSGTPINIIAASYPQIISSFGRSQDVNVTGASGDLDFSETTEEPGGVFEILTADQL